MNERGPIVLLGGGGFGPWIWERVTPILEQHGLDVRIPQLRATGDDATPPADVTLSDWIDDLRVVMANLENVTLIAHSFAGYIAAGAIPQILPRLQTLVLLDAILPSPHKTWFDIMGSDVESYMRSSAIDGGTPWLTRQQLDSIYPNNGISDADLSWMYSRVSLQPLDTFTQAPIDKPIEVVAEDARVHYVTCTRTSPPAAPASARPRNWSTSTIDSSHFPMVTVPGQTALRIIDVARR